MKNTGLMVANRGTGLVLPGRREKREDLQKQVTYDLLQLQTELLLEAGEERFRAMFTQGAIMDVVTLCQVAGNAKLFAPEGHEYFDRLVAEHVEATLRQIRRM